MARYDGRVWDWHEDLEGNRPQILLVDSAGGAWRSAPNGAQRFDGTSTYELDLPYPGDGGVVYMALASDGAWWLAGWNSVYEWTPAS